MSIQNVILRYINRLYLHHCLVQWFKFMNFTYWLERTGRRDGKPRTGHLKVGSSCILVSLWIQRLLPSFCPQFSIRKINLPEASMPPFTSLSICSQADSGMLLVHFVFVCQTLLAWIAQWPYIYLLLPSFYLLASSHLSFLFSLNWKLTGHGVS